MSDDSYWVERAQSAEAQRDTYKDQIDRMKEEVRSVYDTFGAKKRVNGSQTLIDIDFEAFVGKLSLEHALELRAEIDRQKQISGAAGEKPRVKVPSKAAS